MTRRRWKQKGCAKCRERCLSGAQMWDETFSLCRHTQFKDPGSSLLVYCLRAPEISSTKLTETIQLEVHILCGIPHMFSWRDTVLDDTVTIHHSINLFRLSSAGAFNRDLSFVLLYLFYSRRNMSIGTVQIPVCTKIPWNNSRGRWR